MSARAFAEAIWRALGGDEALLSRLRLTGDGSLRSAFRVSDLAQGVIAAAAMAATEIGGGGEIVVDRRLASLWFGWSFRPEGWAAPAPRDPVTGDYEAADGWVRLHANAPHHRDAALRVLGAEVRSAVRTWQADALAEAVVAEGGCAASMRSLEAWAGHPQGRAVAAEPLAWIDRSECDPAGAAPLSSLRVLDLTRVFAGPVCTRVLAGLGAEVLRIDPPHWDEPGTVPDMTIGKRCARLDLRTQEGARVLRDLLARADVLVHGYRPGALDGLGLGPAERRRIRPGLVDVSLDAWGWTGPWAGRRGFDSLVQMASGIADFGMRAAGSARPVPLPVQALDHACGYLMAAACLRGLAARRRGEAWTVRTSLARVAALLAPTAGQGDPEGGIAAQPDDFSPARPTPWGPMRRLRSPWHIDGAGLEWAREASPLGSAAPAWR